MLLSLVEQNKKWTEWPSSVPVDALRAQSRLWKKALRLKEEPFPVVSGRGGKSFVQAKGVTGFLSVGSLRVEVAPKFLSAGGMDNRAWHGALWRILSLIEDEPLSMPSVTAQETSEEALPDLLGWILLDGLRRAQSLGLPRGYTEQEGSLPVLRGRLDSSRLGELLWQPHLLPCVFDVYAEDVPLNRLLRWAASSLAEVVESSSLSRSLSDESMALGEVSPHPPGLVEAENLFLPVQHAHLEGAFHVARLLLRRQSLQHEVDDHAAPAYLWKSSDVFERFVRYLLAQVCARRGWHLSKPTQPLAQPLSPKAERITTIPDYLISSHRKVLLSLDAKYKVGQPKSDDVYQVMAVGRINACPHVGLIYPAPFAGATARTWRICGLGDPQKLTALYVDLLQMATRKGEDDLVGQLANDLSLILNLSNGS